MTHAPTPFTTSPAIEDNVACIYDRGRRQIARVMNTNLLGDDSADTAGFIVTACNAYDSGQATIAELNNHLAMASLKIEASIQRGADYQAALAQQAEQIKALKALLRVACNEMDTFNKQNKSLAVTVWDIIIDKIDTAMEKK